jgi:hypothetical protein
MSCRKGSSEVSRTDDNRAVALRNTEKLADFSVEILDVVAVSLLTEAAEAV